MVTTAMAQTVVTTINTAKYYTLECRSGAAHSTTRFISDNGTVINGQSSSSTFFVFEDGETEGTYYIKSYTSGRYINCDKDFKLSASETKSTAWVLGTVGETVTFKCPGETKYLNNNGTACADGTITNLQANNHPTGPTEGNACSTWALKEYDPTVLPGLLVGTQYMWRSEKQTAPVGEFKKLRVTFLQNTNNDWPAGFPCVAIAEFYLYDKNGVAVPLTENDFSSNATHVGEGSIAALCNGVTTGAGDAYDWYWHSQWGGTPNPYGYHYLEIDLDGVPEGTDLSEFSFGWVTRRSQASPTEIVISTGASSNEAAENANTELYKPELSTEGNVKVYKIQSVRSKKYITYTFNNKQPNQQNNAAQKSAYWYFTEGADGKVVMHNLATEQVLGNDLNMSTSGEWNLLPAKYRPGIVITQNDYSGSCIDEQDSGTTIGNWSHNDSDNEGTTWLFMEVDADLAVSELQKKKIVSIGEPVTEVTDGWYVLNNVGRRNIVSQEVNDWKMRATGNVSAGQSAGTKAGYLFKITKNGEYYNIMSGNGRYFKLGHNTASTSNEPVNIEIGLIDAVDADGNKNDNVFYIYDKVNGRAADGQETGNRFVGWSTSVPTNIGGNDSYKLLPVELTDGVEYVYDYYLNGAKISTETFVNTEFSGLDKYDFVESANVPTGTAVRGTYRVDITDSLPFDYFNNVTSVLKWYFLKMHPNQFGYIQDDDNDFLPYAPLSALPNDATRYNYAWAFIGNPIDGFKVVNHVTGKAISSTGDGDATTTDVANATQWLPKTSEMTGESYFALQYPTNSNYLNANDPNGRLQHWTDADSGSTLMLEEVADNCQYELTDMAGNVYTGQFTYRHSLANDIVLTGAYGYSFVDSKYNEGTWSSKINFAYPVSKVDGATNETLLSINNKYIRRVGDNIKVQTTDVAAVDANCLWAIYPVFNEGAFTFEILNIVTGKYLYTSAEEGKHNTEGTVALNNTSTKFIVASDNDLKVADKNLYLSINSPGQDTDVYLGLHGNVHGGTNILNVTTI